MPRAVLRVVEKRDVLRPRHADHDPQAGARRFVEDVDAGTV